MACSGAAGPVEGPLWIKTSQDDDGTRGQGGLSDCYRAWASPWISLVKSGPNIPASVASDPNATHVGVQTRINVRVRNRHATATMEQIFVEAWVCDTSTGIHPSDPADGTGRFLSGGFDLTPGAFHVAECRPDANDPAWDAALVTGVPPNLFWVPDTGGHFCVMANVFANDDPTSQQWGASPAATTVVSPCCNNHHAQRNIDVLPLPAKFKAMEHSIKAGGQGGTLEAIPVPYGGLGPAERTVLRGRHYGVLKPTLARRRPLDVRIQTRGAEPGRLIELPETRKPREVTITAAFDPRERAGTVHAIDLLQRDERGDEVGGVRLVVVRVPEDWPTRPGGRERPILA